MQGQIESGTIIGILSNDQTLGGTLNSSSDLNGTLSPITPQAVKDYNKLLNKPQINDVELKNNKSLEDLNVTKLTNLEIEEIINSVV